MMHALMLMSASIEIPYSHSYALCISLYFLEKKQLIRGRLHITMPPHQYKYSHYDDKTVKILYLGRRSLNETESNILGQMGRPLTIF